METKPILFSGPMVRALLDGRKTQTRRVLKPDGRPDGLEPNGEVCHYYGDHRLGACLEGSTYVQRLPYAPGDLLWVRETWQAHSWASDCVTIRYRAQEKTVGFTDQIEQIAYPEGNKNTFKFVAPKGPDHWRPSIHMPRWASRLTLRVTDVRVQRVREISEGDARHEGIPNARYAVRPDLSFRDLWDSLNAPRGYGWDANPWVAAYTFVVAHGNVDEVAT